MDRFSLVVKVLGLDRLDDAMGVTVVDAALIDLAPHVARFTQQALSLANFAEPVRSLGRGHWAATFSLERNSVISEGTEGAIESIASAAQELANDAALRIFGPASAALASLMVGCVAEVDAGGPARQIEFTSSHTLDSASGTAIQQILDHQALRTVLQPIVSLPDRHIVGFEALTRGPAGSAFERADQLFGAAARGGLTQELEVACAVQALSYLGRIPAPFWMSVNASTEVAGVLRHFVASQNIARQQLVLELTEHLPLGAIEELRPVLDDLRRGGVRIALDDTGCGYADLDAAHKLNAEIVKLCIAVIGRAEQHVEVRESIAEAVKAAHAYGALVLAEGVETEAQAAMLSAMGIDLAQGWLFGRPFPAAEVESYLTPAAVV